MSRKDLMELILPRFPIELRQITDGTSKTLLMAEKYLRTDLYGDSGTEISVNSCADNNSPYQGYDWDVIRWAQASRWRAIRATARYLYIRPVHVALRRAPLRSVSGRPLRRLGACDLLRHRSSRNGNVGVASRRWKDI